MDAFENLLKAVCAPTPSCVLPGGLTSPEAILRPLIDLGPEPQVSGGALGDGLRASGVLICGVPLKDFCFGGHII